MNLDEGNFKRIRKLIIFTLLGVFILRNYDMVINLFIYLYELLSPFIIGACMAFVLNVPMSFLENKVFYKAKEGKLKKFIRPLSILFSILIVIAIILIVVLVVAPQLSKTIINVIEMIETNMPKIQKWFKNLSDNAEIQEALSDALATLSNMLKNEWASILSSIASITMNIVNSVINLVVAFVFACYILLQKEKLGYQLKKTMHAFLKDDATSYVEHVLKIAANTFSSFITGQCIEAIILGSMFFVSMSLLGMPYAMLIGVLIAFTALIPMFGAFIGCAIGALLILMVNPTQAIIFVVLFLLLQQIEGNLIYPHVVGGSIGLPAIWVLVAVSVGGSLMGIVGMLIFIPLVSVLYALFKEFVNKRLKNKKQSDN